MAKYRPIKTSFWQDEWIATLSPNEKLLFLYLLTNPHTSLCGIYRVSIRYLVFETGLTEKIINQAIERFRKDGKAFYENGWIILKNHIKHQTQSPKIQKGIKRELAEIPQDITKMLYGMDRVSIGMDKPELEPELKTEEDSLRKESLVVFEKIFTAYKEKINKKAILTEQVKLKIKTRLQEFSIEELLESIDKFSRDPWRMEHNSDKGMVWFFKNQEQIAKFLQLKTVEISKITGEPFSTNKKDYPIGTREHYLSPEEIRQFHLFPNQQDL